jgi:crossover junction endodeoxyribonuclease RuvC
VKILGIDHGTRYAGWAVVSVGRRGLTFKGYGLIDLTDHAHPEVLRELKRRAGQLIDQWMPDFVALEKPMAMRSGKVARLLIEMFASCELAALERYRSIIPVTPQLAKMYSAGHAGAEKEDVALALHARYGLEYDEIAVPVLYKSGKRKGQIRDRLFDVSDACALCVAAAELLKAKVETAVGADR